MSCCGWLCFFLLLKYHWVYSSNLRVMNNNPKIRFSSCKVVGLACSVRLLHAAQGPSFLDKGVRTGPTATQFGPACAQTMPYLSWACLRWVEHGAYPLFLLQKELFSSFYSKRNFFPVSATKGTFLQFLQQDWLFCYVAKLPAMQ